MGSNWLNNVGELPGLSIWRIDNKSQEISTVPKGSHGVLRSDDCYITLDTQISSETATSHTIYLWVGKTTAQEAFTAKLADQLEARLGVACTRFREVQEHESSVFQSLFKFRGGIQYVEPLSLAKQRNLREEEHPTKLYHLKGRRNVRVKQVEVTTASLNRGDVFVLDCNDIIYQWNGKSCSRMEKAKALDLTVRLRDERMNRLNAKIILVDDGKETDEFWQKIGGKADIAEATAGGDDEEFEKQSVHDIKLYKVSEKDGGFGQEQVDTKGQHLHRSMLESGFAYIVDAQTEILVWTGRTASQALREHAFSAAADFLKDHNRPSWTPVIKVVEGVEPALFKAKFKGTFTEFIDNPEHLKARVNKINKTAGSLRQETVNVDALLHPEKYAAAKEDDIFEKVIPSKNTDLDEELKIWYVKEAKKHELPLEEYGYFYSHESYVVHFSVRLRSGGYRHVVYFWQGRKSSQDDKGSSALLAQEVAAKFGRSAMQVRVPQNKEPDHFLSHFEGYMVVRKGKRTTWADENMASTVMYQLRGTNKIDTRAVQVAPTCASLNSNDAFLLDTPTTSYAWIGKGANQFERSLADTVPPRVMSDSQKKLTTLNEGEETEDFWKQLGGKTEYSNQESLVRGDVKARLFQCSDRTSVFKVMEIYNFNQDDLDPTDVMILDAYYELYVWIGKGSTQREKEEGVKVAQDYIKLADDGRPTECPIYVVNQGYEPPQFTVYFQGWDDNIAQSEDDLYARKLKTLSTMNFFSISGGDLNGALSNGRGHSTSVSSPAKPAATAALATAAATPAPSGSSAKEPIVDYDRLKANPVPDGVDPKNKELHLSDSQFQQFFKMTREQWLPLPQWKKLRIKKEVGLF